jgi:Transglutaminase-like superfamily
MAELVRSWRSFRGLSWAQRGLLAKAWLLLPVVAIGLRLFGFRRIQARLERAATIRPGREDLAAAQNVARMVQSAARWSPVHPSCLPRSLVVWWLLRRQDLAAGLRIGVARPDGRFAAHAWVEHGGVALGEAENLEERFSSFEETALTRGA